MKRWQKIGIGVAVVLVVIAAMGFWAMSGVRHFLYPPAPPMPTVVSESMADILTQLEADLKTNAPVVMAGLQPGLALADINRLEQQYHIQLPDDLRTLYAWHNGMKQITNTATYDFIPGQRFVPLEVALEDRAAFASEKTTPIQRVVYRTLLKQRESWFCIFDDGSGDGYFFDPARKASEGAVFYTFTEEGAFTFFPSAKNLMAGVAKCYEQGIYHVKAGTIPPQLDEDFEKSGQVWAEFGATIQR